MLTALLVLLPVRAAFADLSVTVPLPPPPEKETPAPAKLPFFLRQNEKPEPKAVPATSPPAEKSPANPRLSVLPPSSPITSEADLLRVIGQAFGFSTIELVTSDKSKAAQEFPAALDFLSLTGELVAVSANAPARQDLTENDFLWRVAYAFDHPWQPEQTILVIEKDYPERHYKMNSLFSFAHLNQKGQQYFLSAFHDSGRALEHPGYSRSKLQILPLQNPDYMILSTHSEGTQGYFFDWMKTALFRGGSWHSTGHIITGHTEDGMAQEDYYEPAARFLACLFNEPDLVLSLSKNAPDDSSFFARQEENWARAARMEDPQWQDCAARTEGWAATKVTQIHGTTRGYAIDDRILWLRTDFLGVCESKKVNFSYHYQLKDSKFVWRGCEGDCAGFDHQKWKGTICGGF